VGQALLVPELDPTQVQDSVLHRHRDLLAPAGEYPLMKGGHDAQRQVDPGAGIADLGSGHQRRAVVEAGRRGGATRTLRGVLVHLAVLVGTGPEPLDRRRDEARIQRLKAFPGEAHAVQDTGAEILHQDVAAFDELLEHLLPRGVLGVEDDRALVVVQHGEVEAVDRRECPGAERG